ncbi:MAG: hypothetical protein ABJB05_01335 [Parafilimonas sp.]
MIAPGGIDSINWTVYGKIQKISKHNGTVINYTYDASGNRLSKIVTGATSGNGETWYIHDASGNVMSIYTVNDATVNSGALTLSEQDVYGSSRLGIYKPALNLVTYTRPLTYMNRLGSVAFYDNFVRGVKFFELSNHLGNVLVTISDKKIGIDNNNNGIIDYYTGDIVSAQDYYPGGMQMPGRTFAAANSSYRYGFNGQEKDTNIQSDHYTAEYWEYDSRSVRRWNVDPMTTKFPWQSPYATMDNNPIFKSDPTGMAASPLDEFDQNGKKISNLGGDKIDFYHQTNGSTKIVDRQTGASNVIKGGEKLIRGYTLRNDNVGWSDIWFEFRDGNGPTKSMFADFNNSDKGPFGSLHSPLSTFSSIAREASLTSRNSKGAITLDYMQFNPFVGKDMWEQMLGRTNVSWYKLGDKTLFLMADSKSMTSLAYRHASSWERSTQQKYGNTYQTYIWVESNEDIKNKVIQNSNYYQQQVKKLQQEIKLQKF